jgi:hypothetical protein
MNPYASVMILFLISTPLLAAKVELEYCQHENTIIDDSGKTVPPGLDEKLNCDHKCFYDELGINLLSLEKPTLQDMYSIGWQITNIVEHSYNGKHLWGLYFEREKVNQPPNECEKTYNHK